MKLSLNKSAQNSINGALIVQINKTAELPDSIDVAVRGHIQEKLKEASKAHALVGNRLYAVVDESMDNEELRVYGDQLASVIRDEKISSAHLIGNSQMLALAEGMMLGNYQFLKYFSDGDKKKSNFNNITFQSDEISEENINELQNTVRAVSEARNLVNEPVSYLSAPQLGKEIQRLSKEYGFTADVWGKKKIESVRMGGLLAVNKGSIDEPMFAIMEWKPENPVNSKPIILVGKGVVYDTGGLSLKPTPNSMDLMKSDMGGSAAVIGAMCAVSANKLNVHVIGLVPATDNRPGENAYAPGDVITMYNGSTVEVLNTDAEGRMILADALAYAKKFEPELVLDAATLTGSAARAVGKFAIVGMGNADKSEMASLIKAGDEVCERVVEFPFWDDYKDELKSTIADIKNLGSAEAGAITAGKFLETFTDYPYIHLDIAGPAFTTSKFNYRGTGGTGVGVRLFYQFLKEKAS